MSYIRVNISDKDRTISGELHGSMTDVLVASLTAEPETIDEFATALQRFVPTESDWPPLKTFVNQENLEPYDAGIVAIDLAARVCGYETTYSIPSKKGRVRVPKGFADEQDRDIYVPYRLPDDWIFVKSMPIYEGTAAHYREERAKNPALDTRQILYGRPLSKFIAQELAKVTPAEREAAVPDIHANWLMTPFDDLKGKTPREVLLEKQDFISSDLDSRMHQWSITKVCPPPLTTESHAYKFGGFGTHESVIYYDMIRQMMYECCDMLSSGNAATSEELFDRLDIVKNGYLASADPEISGQKQSDIIEMERRRINLIMSPQEACIDEDCHTCVAMSQNFDTPMFWFLDGCNMDERFEFSFYKTREEWDEEQRRYEEYGREFGGTLDRSVKDHAIQSKEDPF